MCALDTEVLLVNDSNQRRNHNGSTASTKCISRQSRKQILRIPVLYPVSCLRLVNRRSLRPLHLLGPRYILHRVLWRRYWDDALRLHSSGFVWRDGIAHCQGRRQSVVLRQSYVTLGQLMLYLFQKLRDDAQRNLAGSGTWMVWRIGTDTHGPNLGLRRS